MTLETGRGGRGQLEHGPVREARLCAPVDRLEEERLLAAEADRLEDDLEGGQSARQQGRGGRRARRQRDARANSTGGPRRPSSGPRTGARCRGRRAGSWTSGERKARVSVPRRQRSSSRWATHVTENPRPGALLKPRLLLDGEPDLLKLGDDEGVAGVAASVQAGESGKALVLTSDLAEPAGGLAAGRDEQRVSLGEDRSEERSVRTGRTR